MFYGYKFCSLLLTITKLYYKNNKQDVLIIILFKMYYNFKSCNSFEIKEFLQCLLFFLQLLVKCVKKINSFLLFNIYQIDVFWKIFWFFSIFKPFLFWGKFYWCLKTSCNLELKMNFPLHFCYPNPLTTIIIFVSCLWKIRWPSSIPYYLKSFYHFDSKRSHFPIDLQQ